MLFNKVTFQANQELVYDLVDAKYLFLYSCLIALGASIVLMILMICCAGLVFWLIVLAAIGLLIAFGVVMLMAEYYPQKLNDGVNAARVKYLSFIKVNKTWITLICVFCFLLALYLLFIICKYGKVITKVIPVIKKSFSTALANSMLIFLSIFTMML